MADMLARAENEGSLGFLSHVCFICRIVLRNGLGYALEAVFCGLGVGGMTLIRGSLDSLFLWV